MQTNVQYQSQLLQEKCCFGQNIRQYKIQINDFPLKLIRKIGAIRFII